MIPTLLHIPHASRVVPDEWRSLFLLDEVALAREIVVMTDHATDRLFDLPGASRLIFLVSRLLVDPERYADDAREPMAERGMGAVYVRTHDGLPLKTDTSRAELMARFYEPHHQALQDWCDAALHESDLALILDCHSFPSQALPCDLDQAPNRPQICLGTASDRHTPGWLLDAALAVCERRDWIVGVDRPYAGAMVPERRWADPRVLALMIEVRRDLYLEEATGSRGPRFEEVRRGVTRIMEAVVESCVAQGDSRD